jgi:hypothetical protein
MTARAIRNCNPLNLRPSGDEWLGLRSEQTDPGYLQFETDFHGLRAAAKNLLTYYRIHGRRTVRSIIESWAPPSDDNPTDAYISTVCKALGLGPDDHVNLEDGRILRSLMVAMVRVEAGSQPFSVADFDAAINAAYASHRAPPVASGPPSDAKAHPTQPVAERGPQIMPIPQPPPPAKPVPPVAGRDEVVPPAAPPLVNQPSPLPTRKLVVGGAAGATAFVIMAIWNKLFPSMPLPAEYAVELASVVVLGVTLVTQYFTRNRATDVPPGPVPAPGEREKKP